MKNRGATAHENTSPQKTKKGTTLIMAPAITTVFRVGHSDVSIHRLLVEEAALGPY